MENVVCVTIHVHSIEMENVETPLVREYLQSLAGAGRQKLSYEKTSFILHSSCKTPPFLYRKQFTILFTHYNTTKSKYEFILAIPKYVAFVQQSVEQNVELLVSGSAYHSVARDQDKRQPCIVLYFQLLLTKNLLEE